MSEFVDTPLGELPSDWVVDPLCVLTSKITDGAHFSPAPQEEGELIANVKDMRRNGIDFDGCTRILREDFEYLSRQNCSPSKGDVLLSKDGTIGRVVLFDGSRKIVLLSSIAILKPLERLDSSYLKHVLTSSHFDKQLYALQSGSALKRIVLSDIKKLLVPYPCINKQRKTAKILSTVDNLIEKTQALIDKYQSIKQGMMHDLFTRGVDEHGQLRLTYEEAPYLYKESELGWIPKEWEVTTLQCVMDFLDGQRIPLKKEDRADMQGDIPYYGASGIIDHVNDYIFDGDYILLGEDGENVISRNLPLAFKVSGKIWVNNHAHILRPTEGSHIDFYTEYLESKDYSSIISGSAQPKITQGYLSRVVVIKPEYHEQANIAQKLFALHAKTEKENEYLDKLKVLKSGLMQDLLSGKVRVKVDSKEECVA